MTSTLVFGFFPLLNGRRIAGTTASGAPTAHIEYSSQITIDDTEIPCRLRMWAAPGQNEHPHNTIAFLVGKFHACPGDPVLIDVLSIHAVPGDPNSPTYEDSIPDFNVPWAVVLGHSSGAAAPLADGVSRGFTLNASEYVRKSPRSAPYHARFDGNSPRWNNTPAPHINSACQVYGAVAGLHQGMLSIGLANITLNIGPTTASSTAQTPSSATSSPAKRRRFQVSAATNSPATPAATASAASAVASSSSTATLAPGPAPSLIDDIATEAVEGEDVDDVAVPLSAKARGKRRAPAS